MITSCHVKYFAHELTQRHGHNGIECLSQFLFDASVDLKGFREQFTNRSCSR